MVHKDWLAPKQKILALKLVSQTITQLEGIRSQIPARYYLAYEEASHSGESGPEGPKVMTSKQVAR